MYIRVGDRPLIFLLGCAHGLVDYASFELFYFQWSRMSSEVWLFGWPVT